MLSYTNNNKVLKDKYLKTYIVLYKQYQQLVLFFMLIICKAQWTMGYEFIRFFKYFLLISTLDLNEIKVK